MKRNLSRVVLVLEIFSIAFLHAMKIRNEHKAEPRSVISRIKSPGQPAGTKSPLVFLKIK